MWSKHRPLDEERKALVQKFVPFAKHRIRLYSQGRGLDLLPDQVGDLAVDALMVAAHRWRPEQASFLAVLQVCCFYRVADTARAFARRRELTEGGDFPWARIPDRPGGRCGPSTRPI